MGQGSGAADQPEEDEWVIISYISGMLMSFRRTFMSDQGFYSIQVLYSIQDYISRGLDPSGSSKGWRGKRIHYFIE